MGFLVFFRYSLLLLAFVACINILNVHSIRQLGEECASRDFCDEFEIEQYEATAHQSFAPNIFFSAYNKWSYYLVLQHIPVLAFEEKMLEVSVWYETNSSSKDPVERFSYFPSLLVIEDFPQFRKMPDRHPEFCILGVNIFDQQLREMNTSPLKIRAVLRFLVDKNQDSRPVPFSKIPTMMAEVMTYPQRFSDWEDIDLWQHPDLSSLNPHLQYLSASLKISLERATAGESKLTVEELSRIGYSGSSFRHFLNNLASNPNTRYLEVGVFNGSTLFSVLKGNQVQAVAIDSWEGNESHVKADFLKTLETAQGQNSVTILQSNCWRVNMSDVLSSFHGKRATVFFYDGPHDAEDHFLSLMYYSRMVEDNFIFIVDDWQWAAVREATNIAITSLGLTVAMKVEVTTSSYPESFHGFDSIHRWHNGMAAFVLEKQG